MASYAYLIAPPGAGTTLQGIFGAVFEGIGNLFNHLVKSFLYLTFKNLILQVLLSVVC